MTQQPPKINITQGDAAAVRSEELELQKSISRLSMLAKIPGMLVGSEPLKVQIGKLAAMVCEAFDVDTCIVRTLDDGDMVLVAAAGVDESELAPRFPCNWGACQQIVKKKQSIYIPDVRVDPITAPIVNTLPSMMKFHSYAGAPMIVEGEVIGILGVFTKQRELIFSETDVEHLQIVAHPIAIAIMNDRLFKEVCSQKEAMVKEMEERTLLEARFLQAQKMESIGNLAGGIAHDFNNLLMSVMGFNELASMELDEANPVQSHLKNVAIAADRASGLTLQLLAFARKQTTTPRVFSMNSLIEETKRMMSPLIGDFINLSLLYDINDTVKLDPGQMQQVLVNLIINARDAMPSGGNLTLKTRYSLTQSCDPAASASEDGPYVCVEICDTGVGMPPEVLERIFEPFYTTKELGKGTGLGLATCYGIVKQNCGHICVTSSPGEGTTFFIYLPYHHEDNQTYEEFPIEDSIPRGSESVLLVEDDAQVREMITLWLKHLGYRVTSAHNGLAALNLVLERSGGFSIVITDSAMPEMGGYELSSSLHTLYPDLPVITLSGYSEDPHFQSEALDFLRPFLQKPFSSGTLARKVREVLDASKS